MLERAADTPFDLGFEQLQSLRYLLGGHSLNVHVGAHSADRQWLVALERLLGSLVGVAFELRIRVDLQLRSFLGHHRERCPTVLLLDVGEFVGQ